jgi:putative multiple sugar transport system permease protein
METEPLALFIGKNAVFAILIAGFCYQLASCCGLPNVLIIMGALILLDMFVTCCGTGSFNKRP